MDRFHIYEEIGKGRKSQVYKGRERSTIKYVAIKRIDKSEMDSVSAQVALMHRFSSPHILKFHDWYETRNNLWLILEFAPGGDLKSLLAADMRMPESSIKIFGVDLMAGMLYLHSKGVIYADLKPSNVLVDEYGVLKLSDFGLARRIPSSYCDNNTEEVSMRGTPHYMAPELFTPGGCHSYASEVWSLGCVLYEMFYGSPPFTSTSLNTLIKSILNDNPPFTLTGGDSNNNSLNNTATTTPSTKEFHHLLSCLLNKDPLKRPTWAELLMHPFWNVAPPPELLKLPKQVGFDETLKLWKMKLNVSEFDADFKIKQAQYDNVRGDYKKVVGEIERFMNSKGKDASVPALTEAEGGSNGNGNGHVQSSAIDVMRISRNVQNNLAKEVSLANARGHGHGNSNDNDDDNDGDLRGRSKAKIIDGDVAIVDADTELDFTDRKKSRNGNSHGNKRDEEYGNESGGNGSVSGESESQRQSQSHSQGYTDEDFDSDASDVEEVEEISLRRSNSRQVASQSNDRDGSSVVESVDDTRDNDTTTASRGNPDISTIEHEQESSSENKSKANYTHRDSSSYLISNIENLSILNITPLADTTDDNNNNNTSGPCTELDNLSICSLLENANAAMNERDDDNATNDNGPPTLNHSASKIKKTWKFVTPASKAEALVFCPSDAAVKPIVGNKSIEITLRPPSFRLSAITSISLKSRAEIKAWKDGNELESYFGVVYKCVASSNTTVIEKVHIFGYLYSICDVQPVANLIANSSFVTLLLRMMRKKTGGDAGRIALAFILGVVIRHASYIAPDASEKEEGLLYVLSSIVRDGGKSNTLGNSAPLRRRAVAALGELIFYVATGNDGDGWVLPADAINTMLQCLTHESDLIVSLYAAKVIENVLAQAKKGDSVAKRLCTIEVAQKLLEMAQPSSPSNSNLNARKQQQTQQQQVNSSSSSSSSSSPDATTTTASGSLSQIVSHLLIGCGAGGLNASGSSPSTDLSTSSISYADWQKGTRIVSRILLESGTQDNVDGLKVKLINGISDNSGVAMQQAWLNIINLLLWDGPSAGSSSSSLDDDGVSSSSDQGGKPSSLKLLRGAMIEDDGNSPNNNSNNNNTSQKQTLVLHLTRLAERGQNGVIRGKALVAILGLCKCSALSLSYACEKRLLPLLERVASRGDDLKSNEYFWSCASSLVAFLSNVPTATLTSLRAAHEALLLSSNIDTLQKQRKDMKVIVDKAIRYLPSVVQCVGCRLLRDEGCVDAQMVRNLGWALQTFGVIAVQDKDRPIIKTETQLEIVRLLLLVLEMLVQHAEECLFVRYEEFIGSILPVLCRFLKSANKDSKTLSISLLRLILPGMFVHVTAVNFGVDAYADGEDESGRNITHNVTSDLLLQSCDHQLLPALVPLLKEEDPISQYSLLLLSELAGSAGSLYGTSSKAVWGGLSTAISKHTSLVNGLMEKVKDEAGCGAEGVSNNVLASCLCLLIENSFKEQAEKEKGKEKGGGAQIPPLVNALLAKSFAGMCCRCLSKSASRGDNSAVLHWLNCCKCLICVVTFVIPSNRTTSEKSDNDNKSPNTPLESPPPVSVDAWGSSILSPTELDRMQLTDKNNNDTNSKLNPTVLATCRLLIDNLAAAANLFARLTSHFDVDSPHASGIADVASWVLSALVSLSPAICFEKMFDSKAVGSKGRGGGGGKVAALDGLTQTIQNNIGYFVSSKPYENSDTSRVAVRAVRILGLAADFSENEHGLREISRNYDTMEYLSRITASANDKEVVLREVASRGSAGRKVLEDESRSVAARILERVRNLNS